MAMPTNYNNSHGQCSIAVRTRARIGTCAINSTLLWVLHAAPKAPMLQTTRSGVWPPCSPSAASRASLARPATCGEHVSQARGMQSMTSGCSTCLHECSRGCRRCSLDGCAPLQPSKPAAQAAQLVHTTCSSCSSRGASCAQQMTQGTQISGARGRMETRLKTQ